MKWSAAISCLLLCCTFILTPAHSRPIGVTIGSGAGAVVDSTAVNTSAATGDVVETVEPRRMTFTYQDVGYDRVEIAASFTEWVRIPLTLADDEWAVMLPVPVGPQFYHFIVTGDGESWTAIDPQNPSAVNHPEYGWVAEIDFVATADPGLTERRERQRQKKSRRRHRKLIRQELLRGTPYHGFTGYQRVDGFSLALVFNHIGRKGSLDPSARGYFGYGFSSGRAGAGVTILQPLTTSRVLAGKVSLYDWTDFTDQTGIGGAENFLAAMFLHEDYRDYYRNKGVRGSVVLQPAGWLRLETGVLAEEHYSLGARSVWSIKKGDFSANPAIDEGSLRSAVVQIQVGGRDNHLRFGYEHSGPDLMGGDFDFRQITATVRGQLNLGERAGFKVRLKGGRNLHGRLPAQRRYVLGGLGTVRGYAYQSLLTGDPAAPPGSDDRQPYGGEQMLLGNIEYSFRLAGWLGMALFYDAGMAWQDRDASVSLNGLKTSTGLGFRPCDSESVRLDLIQRLDDRDSEPVFQFRLQRMF